MTSEPPLLVLWYDLVKWILQKTEKFPKRVRFTLSNRIDNLALDIMERLTQARYARSKRSLLEEVSARLDRLRLLFRLCHDLGHLDHGAYRHVSENLDEAGRMLGGWLKSLDGRKP